MKIKTIWTGLPFPHNWEFSAQCEEGESIPIIVKNDDKTTKKAPNPKEVVLQGMATCTGIDVVSILQKMRQPLESLYIECEAHLTEQHPIVFSECDMTYYIKGKDLSIDRVALAVKLSFMDYCGVTAMIKKSGCFITPKLFVNEKEINIWDPKDLILEKMKKVP
jgi:putative redox protein